MVRLHVDVPQRGHDIIFPQLRKLGHRHLQRWSVFADALVVVSQVADAEPRSTKERALVTLLRPSCRYRIDSCEGAIVASSAICCRIHIEISSSTAETTVRSVLSSPPC